MFIFLKNNEAIATSENPTWVRKSPNGTLVKCAREDAHGVNLGGAVYHIPGRALIGAEDVAVAEVDTYELVKTQMAEQNTMMSDLEDAIVELADIIGGM